MIIVSNIKKIPVELYSRVVGYFRSVNQWNPGKKEEFKDRNEFDPKQIKESLKNE